MKSIAVCISLALAVGVVACKTSSPAKNASNPAAMNLVATSTSQPIITPHAASLAEQRMCDEQALKKFREYDEPHAAYRSHYDPSVNVCYVSVNYTHVEDKIPETNIDVFDAFEGHQFATYFWSNPKRKPYMQVPPYTCEITIPGRDMIICNSAEEFDELVDKYFGLVE